MIDRKTLLAVIVVCFSIFLAGLLCMCAGCSVYRFPRAIAPERHSFADVLRWSERIEQTNEALVDRVIGLQRGGSLPMLRAKTILAKQVGIAQANHELAGQIRAAELCGEQARAEQAAEVRCARISGGALDREIRAMRAALVLDADEHDFFEVHELAGSVATMGMLVENISSTLEKQGVIR